MKQRTFFKSAKQIITVTGALTTPASLALCELIQDGIKDNEVAKIKWEFVANAQRFCDPKPHQDYLGFFVYTCDELYMKYEPSTDVVFGKWPKMQQKKYNIM